MARPALAAAEVQEQRERLIAAALALYRAQGYEAVTLRGLAAQLGISHVTPYRYFKSKEALFAAIRTEIYTHFADHLEAADRPDQPALVRLRSICLAVVDFGRRYPDDYRLIFSLRQPAASEYPELQKIRVRPMNYAIVICQQAIDSGQLQGDAKTWAHVAWSSIHGLLSLHVANLLMFGRSLDSLVEPLLSALLPGTANAVKRRAAAPSKRICKSQRPPETAVPFPSPEGAKKIRGGPSFS